MAHIILAQPRFYGRIGKIKESVDGEEWDGRVG
jgi:hypothetical protein